MSEVSDSPEHGLICMLTDRECEVLGLFAQGLANKVVAAELNISEQTVKAHAKSIYRKLRVANRVQALLVYQKHR